MRIPSPRTLAVAALGFALLGCDDRAPLDPNLASIRPASPAARPESENVEYVVSPESRLTFSFKKRQGFPTGTVTRLSGAIRFDLTELGTARGAVSADLSSTQVSAAHADAPPDPTATALGWLGVGIAGTDGPTARFDLHGLEGPSVHAAFMGKLEKPPERLSDAGAARPEESRTVTFTAKGDLTVLARRAEARWRMKARFEYGEPAMTGALPTRIVLETRRPTPLSLSVFDILPRNPDGTRNHAAAPRVRKRLGREALVSAYLVLTPAPRP